MDAPNERSLLEPKRVGMLALIVAVIIGTMALGLPRLANSNSDDDPVVVERRQTIDPPRALTDFTLTNQHGEPTSLSDLQGKPVLLFFGFTHCPDICPTTFAEFRVIKRELGELGDQANFVMVSVDGTRDTPEVLRDYVEKFDPAFIGLTGDEEDVRAVSTDYYLFFNRSAGTPTAAGYLVDHTAYSYLIDQQGNLRTIYPFQAPLNLIVDDMRKLIAGSASQ